MGNGKPKHSFLYFRHLFSWCGNILTFVNIFYIEFSQELPKFTALVHEMTQKVRKFFKKYLRCFYKKLQHQEKISATAGRDKSHVWL